MYHVDINSFIEKADVRRLEFFEHIYVLRVRMISCHEYNDETIVR